MSKVRRIVILSDELNNDKVWQSGFPSLVQGYIDSNGIRAKVHPLSSISDIRSFTVPSNLNSDDVIIQLGIEHGLLTSFITICSSIIELRRSPKVITLWTRCPDKPVMMKKPIRMLEQGIYDASVHNVFYSREQMDLYKHHAFWGIRHLGPIELPMPLDYIGYDLYRYIPTNMDGETHIYKDDTVVLTFDNPTDNQLRMLYDTKKHLSGILMDAICELDNVSKSEKITKLSRSKVSWIPYSKQEMGVEIYEALCCDTIPLVPDLPMFRRILPIDFLYPSDIDLNMMEYSSRAIEFHNKIRYLIENYDTYVPMLEDLKSKYQTTIFNSTPVLELIFV